MLVAEEGRVLGGALADRVALDVVGVEQPGTTRLSARERQRVFAKYPSLLALLDQLAGARAKPGASYEAGLELLVDGMATRLGGGKRPRVRAPS